MYDSYDDADGSDGDDDDAVGPHEDADNAASSDAADSDACRAANPGRAGIPRTCLVRGETAHPGNSFFANHLNAAYNCPYTRASPSDSSGADSGPGACGGSEMPRFGVPQYQTG